MQGELILVLPINQFVKKNVFFQNQTVLILQEFLKLHDKYQEQKAEVALWMDAAANAKKEAVKEFAEKLKKGCGRVKTEGRSMLVFTESSFDYIVKEFTEEKT
jgi:hypothetical protein